jgi:ribosomal protein L44E
VVPVPVPVPPVPIVVVGGRRTRPVCAQALPWARGFIGCPGIACDASHDFTSLFDHDGARACGNRKSTPLEVDNPKDATHFRARSAECPWSRRRVQRTLERASDPVTLRALLDEFAPRAKAVKKKHVDGQCSSCYSAHMTLIRSMDARKKLATSRRGGGGRGNDGEGDARAASGVDVG